MPLAAMLREIDGLRLKDRDDVTAKYKTELEQAKEKRRQAQLEEKIAKDEANKQSDQFATNEYLVNKALKAIKNDNPQPINPLQGSKFQAWELFCRSKPLTAALRNGKLKVFTFLLKPQDPKFAIDYVIADPEPVYEFALSLDDDCGIENWQGIHDVMMERILKDVSKLSADWELGWLFHAIECEPKLISSTLPNHQGLTVAMKLAKENCLPMLIAIYQQGIKIEFDQKDNFGKTMFDYSLENGHRELSLWLLDQTNLALSPIEQACIDKNLPEIKRLLAINNSLVNPAIRNNAPLLWAVMHGYKEIVDELISPPLVDVRANNNIAVITAVRYGNFDIAHKLVNQGADIADQNDLALNFARKLSRNTKESRIKRQEMFYFVLDKRRGTAAYLDTKKNNSEIKILHLWRKYKLRVEEKFARQTVCLEEQSAIKTNVEPELQMVKSSLRNEPARFLQAFYNNSTVENAKRLSSEQCRQAAINISNVDMAEVLVKVEPSLVNIFRARINM